ncbi:JAB domain-containing protein [Carnobacterium maltaromaticum]|uniref:JAB domain-containing protein n=1 Tax=Carnobacterium maltaromaticum TaxID=2751 RepID=UPI0039BDC234
MRSKEISLSIQIPRWRSGPHNAARILIYHNHPSGDVLPSEADKQFTKKLFKVGELLGIEVLDHIIVSEDDAFSFRESQF